MWFKTKQFWQYFFLVLWIAFAVIGMYYHEVWRDEMRPLSIARESAGYVDLWHRLKYEGHPPLWYFLLKFLDFFFHSSLVLPILSIFFATINAWLLLFKSPFPLLINVLLAFGFYTLYEYGIQIRNYGIAETLLFGAVYFTTVKKQYLTAMMLLGIAVFTNIYAMAFALLLGLNLLANKGTLNKKLLSAYVVVLLMALVSVYSIWPGADSLATNHTGIYWPNFKLAWHLSRGFSNFDPLQETFSSIWISVGLYALCLGMWRIPKLAFSLFLGTFFMSFFAVTIRSNYPHHHGMWFIFLLSLFWLYFPILQEKLKAVRTAAMPFIAASSSLLFVLLLFLFYKGIYMWKYDVFRSKSDSKAFGAFLQKNIPSKTVLICEPDYTMESAVYYAYRPYFLPRENRFGYYANFTKQNKQYLSLAEVMQIADSFAKQNKAIAFVFNFNPAYKDSVFVHSYDKRFAMNPASKKAFAEKYALTDSFCSTYFTDERYYLFKRRG